MGTRTEKETEAETETATAPRTGAIAAPCLPLPPPSLSSPLQITARDVCLKNKTTTTTEVREVKQRKTPNSAAEFGSVYDISSQCCGIIQ